MNISATIVTLNEEKNIARAIASLACADEVLVVDSGSSDRTVEIATSLGARVIEEPWRGYAGQKNFAAKAATNDWILSIDADEELTKELQAEITALKAGEPELAGYTMPRLAQYLGRWIRHSGWYPDRKIRLYHRGRAAWEGAFVHESVKTTGRTADLRGNLLHYTCASLTQHVRTMDRYTGLAAQEMLTNGKSASVGMLVFDPLWTFFRTYIMKRGFLDGPQGVAIAWMAAFYVFLKYARTRAWS